MPSKSPRGEPLAAERARTGAPPAVAVDCHVHVVAVRPEHGRISPTLRKRWTLRIIRRLLGLDLADEEAAEERLAALLERELAGAPELGAAVLLAFDAVYGRDGRLEWERTHFYVTNDYARDVAARLPRARFGASVHPYRADALAELERCVAGGAALLKWLPLTQGINPADPRCLPFYDALAHHGLPLLCHTGGEQSLPTIDPAVEDPRLLIPALERGVTVICAHCGTRSAPWGTDWLPHWARMAREYERCYGDTAGLDLPARSYAYRTLLDDAGLRAKLVHGSDWPLPAVPPVRQLGVAGVAELLRERNTLRRDVLIKRRLGLDDAYFARAGTLLK